MRRYRVMMCVLGPLALTACQTVPAQPGFSKRQVAVLTGNGFVSTGANWELGMADRLLFATDESVLVPRQQQRIGQMVGALVAVGIRGAEVQGHTDSVGSMRYNDALSQRRAQAVGAAMANGGMDRRAIRVVGLGERDPVENNGTVEGRQENRRVVILVTPTDAMTP
jgi:outer membrane protein OmpA-like peptidoglycan-associated protein